MGVYQQNKIHPPMCRLHVVNLALTLTLTLSPQLASIDASSLNKYRQAMTSLCCSTAYASKTIYGQHNSISYQN